MKRVALTLCMLVGNIPWAFADDSALAATVPASTQTTLMGVIKFVSWADPVKHTKSEIIVTDAKGKATNIYVAATTTLWDADAKAIMRDKIIARHKVNVIYLTTDEGINIAKSIKILK